MICFQRKLHEHLDGELGEMFQRFFGIFASENWRDMITFEDFHGLKLPTSKDAAKLWLLTLSFSIQKSSLLRNKTH